MVGGRQLIFGVLWLSLFHSSLTNEIRQCELVLVVRKPISVSVVRTPLSSGFHYCDGPLGSTTVTVPYSPRDLLAKVFLKPSPPPSVCAEFGLCVSFVLAPALAPTRSSAALTR